MNKILSVLLLVAVVSMCGCVDVDNADGIDPSNTHYDIANIQKQISEKSNYTIDPSLPDRSGTQLLNPTIADANITEKQASELKDVGGFNITYTL